MKTATEKDFAEHLIRLAEVITSSVVTVSHTPLLISTLRLQRDLMTMKVWWMRRHLGMRVIVVSM